jgi:translation initiation factor 1
MAKSKTQQGGLVYSTNPALRGPLSPAQTNNQTLPPAQQDLRVTLDKKLKGGKVATVIYNFVGPEDALEELGKHLKQKCGVGGAAKNNEILIQGNQLQKVTDELKRLGYRFKVAGI